VVEAVADPDRGGDQVSEKDSAGMSSDTLSLAQEFLAEMLGVQRSSV
jgi:hypothetical protein